MWYFYWFIFRQKGREGEKHQCVVASCEPLLGSWPTIQACALTGNWTCNPLVLRLVVNPLSHTSQGKLCDIFDKMYNRCLAHRSTPYIITTIFLFFRSIDSLGFKKNQLQCLITSNSPNVLLITTYMIFINHQFENHGVIKNVTYIFLHMSQVIKRNLMSNLVSPDPKISFHI